MQDLMPPVNTPDKLFHDGDDSTGVEGTILYAEFMNNEQGAVRDIQQEMKNVLADAGFTPDPAKHNQLLLAIQKLMGTAVEGVVRSVNNHGPGANGDVELPDASTTEKGLTQLSSATNSDSETLAATPKAVKATHDLAAAALPLTGGTMTGETKSTSANILRGIQGGYGAILRMDANGLYFLQTNKDDPNGNYNDKRSLTIANDTGAVGIGTQLTVTNADFINKVGYTTYTGGDGHNHAQVGGLRLEVDGSQLAELYYNVDTTGKSAEVSLHNKYGATDSYLSLRNDGLLNLSGSSPQINFSNGTTFAIDGNVKGSVWDNSYLSSWILNKADDAKDAAIDWANTNCARKPTSWLQPTGWFRDATSGLITQWGRITAPRGTRVTFPMVFPSECFSITITPGTSNEVMAMYYDDNASGFTLGLNSGAAYSVSWKAVGK